MKNNIMAIAKSKKFMAISVTIALAALLIMAGKFLGIHYYMVYLIYNLDDAAEIILKLGIFVAVISILIAFLIKKDNKNNNSVINRDDNSSEDKNSAKQEKLWLIPIIVTIAVILLLFLASRFLGIGYYGMYMFHNLDDIIEGFFQLSISIAVIVFLAVFFKKIWNKL